MLTFKDFLIESVPSKKYVAVQYDTATSKKLRKWAEDNGFDLTLNYDGEKQNPDDFDFHTTIFYTTTEHDIQNQIFSIPSKSAKIVGFELLGINKDVPVLKVQSDAISEIRRYFVEVHEMKDAWPNYIPHVSLSYSKELPDVKNIKLPTFELTFDQIKIDNAMS